MKNKGFTLVEILVAVIIASVLSVSIASLIILTIQNYNRINNEAEIQIEGQIISEYIKSIIHGCESYTAYALKFTGVENDLNKYEQIDSFDSSDVILLEIQARYRNDFRTVLDDGSVSYNPIGGDIDIDTIGDGYYYVLIDKEIKTAYVIYSRKKEVNTETGQFVLGKIISNRNFLGEYITDFNISPTVYSYEDSLSEKNFKYEVKLDLTVENSGYSQDISTSINLRSK